ncbi:unnamed protein product, partial [Mesorhabditis belari]|uniref:DUF7758 domain-containing protein n=1 Tax=Mesorhabditis belari TaxID=2138241 RepID=A0AAF3EH16_9BILA
MSTPRNEAFDKARTLQEAEKADEALELIRQYVEDQETELSVKEIETLSYILQEKMTSASFDSKKEACYEAIDILEGLAIAKEQRFILAYAEAAYESFSKINRSARDEERENVWCRAKEMYLELFKTAKKTYKEVNNLERLEIYVNFAKLAKSYLDVADEDSLNICEEAAKEAKFVGPTGLSKDDWNEIKRQVDQIKKYCKDSRAERKLLDDE